MLPPLQMETIKNRATKEHNRILRCHFVLFAALVLLAGCTPPGPRALLQGVKLIERGKYTDAIARLETATSILTTNAHAWNYLGVACHHAGQNADAEKAYQHAVALDHDLS